MARTKVSSVAQPEDFRETLEDWGVPLTNSVPSLRRYLPLILAKFVETMCDDLEAHLPANEKSAKIHFITASDAQLSRTAAKGKAVESPAAAAAPSPVPAPVPAPAKRAYRKREKPIVEANSEAGPSRPAVTPYLAERSSRRQPLASTSKPRSPAKKLEEPEEEEKEVEVEDEELENKLDGQDEDEDPDEGAGGESSGSGSGAEPDGRDEGAGGGHDTEDNSDSPGDSGSSHAPSGALRSLSLDPSAAPSLFAFSWPTTLPQPLTSTNLLTLSNSASDSADSTLPPRKPAFRAPTPIAVAGDSDDSDADEHPAPGPRRTYPSPPSSSALSSLSDSPEPEPDSPEPVVIHPNRRRSSRHHSPHDSRLRLSSPTPSASSSSASSSSSSTSTFESLHLVPSKKITPPAPHLNNNLADPASKQRRTTFEVLIPLKRYRFELDEGSSDPVKRCKLDGVAGAGPEGSALTVAAAA